MRHEEMIDGIIGLAEKYMIESLEEMKDEPVLVDLFHSMRWWRFFNVNDLADAWTSKFENTPEWKFSVVLSSLHVSRERWLKESGKGWAKIDGIGEMEITYWSSKAEAIGDAMDSSDSGSSRSIRMDRGIYYHPGSGDYIVKSSEVDRFFYTNWE